MNDAVPSWLTSLAGATPRRRTFARDQTVFREGDVPRQFFRIAHGRVRMARVLPDGRTITMATASAGETFAEASMFSDRYHCDALAECDSEIDCYSIADVRASLNHCPTNVRGLTADLARQVRDLRSLLEIRNIRRADERLLAWLHCHVRDKAATVEIKGTWTSVAQQIGLSREALYRALASLEKAHRIVRENGIVRLPRTIAARERRY